MGKVQLVEENHGELLGRVYVNDVPHIAVDPGFQIAELLVEAAGHFMKDTGLQGDTVALHGHQHRRQWHLQSGEQLPEPLLPHGLFEHGP